MAALEPTFNEQAALFGERQSLVGIISKPVSANATSAPAVIIFNTGIVHRIGHHRMYVKLARMLAERGRTVVRFDFSGVGDSKPRSGGLSPLAASLADIKDVLDSVEKTHRISQFVLVGLCSGADHAVLYGHTDPRVVGFVLMDPTMPPTPRYYLHYVLQRLTSVRNWISFVTLRSGLLRLLSAHVVNRMRPTDDLEGLTLQNLKFSSYLAKCYRRASERGIKMLSVFTAMSVRQTYERQMLEAFPETASGGALRLEFFPESDHLFSAEKERARLNRVILDWLRAN
ncbi:MAG: alpha/beta fold hydrolase [Gammaproteobacteria bacterium]